MAAQKEIPMDDSELDALMAELEAETSGIVVTPTAAAPAPAPTPAPAPATSAELSESDLDGLDDIDAEQLRDQASAEGVAVAEANDVSDADIAEVAAELNATGQVSTDDAVALEQARQARENDATAAEMHGSQEDELAALQAELDAEQGSAPVAAAPAPAVEPVAKAAVLHAAPPIVTAVAAPATEPIAADEPAHPNPRPAKKTPQLQFHLDVDAFKGEIAVSENNLDTAMMQQAGLFAWHAAEAARAEAQHARVKLRFEVVEAKLYDRHRKALALTGEKVTEKMVENAVKLDPEYLQAKNLVIEAEMLSGFNKAAVEALRHRKDMIVQLGADRREESKGQVRTLAHEDNKARALAAVK